MLGLESRSELWLRFTPSWREEIIPLPTKPTSASSTPSTRSAWSPRRPKLAHAPHTSIICWQYSILQLELAHIIAFLLAHWWPIPLMIRCLSICFLFKLLNRDVLLLFESVVGQLCQVAFVLLATTFQESIVPALKHLRNWMCLVTNTEIECASGLISLPYFWKLIAFVAFASALFDQLLHSFCCKLVKWQDITFFQLSSRRLLEHNARFSFSPAPNQRRSLFFRRRQKRIESSSERTSWWQSMSWWEQFYQSLLRCGLLHLLLLLLFMGAHLEWTCFDRWLIEIVGADFINPFLFLAFECSILEVPLFQRVTHIVLPWRICVPHLWRRFHAFHLTTVSARISALSMLVESLALVNGLISWCLLVQLRSLTHDPIAESLPIQQIYHRLRLYVMLRQLSLFKDCVSHLLPLVSGDADWGRKFGSGLSFRFPIVAFDSTLQLVIQEAQV